MATKVSATTRKEMEHLQKATQAWSDFRKEIQAHATNSETERARRDREEKDDTTFHEQSNKQTGG